MSMRDPFWARAAASACAPLRLQPPPVPKTKVASQLILLFNPNHHAHPKSVNDVVGRKCKRCVRTHIGVCNPVGVDAFWNLDPG